MSKTPTIPTSSQPSQTPPTPTPSPTSQPASTTPSTNPLRPLLLLTLLTCPFLALLPPRKLDLYTFALSSAWVLSAEELAFGERRRQRQRHVGGTGVMGILGRADTSGDVGGKVEGDGEGERERDEGVGGMLGKLWMGDEKAGWEKRRVEREKEVLEEGKGYGDIIMGQVREVFPGFGGGRRDGEEEG